MVHKPLCTENKEQHVVPHSAGAGQMWFSPELLISYWDEPAGLIWCGCSFVCLFLSSLVGWLVGCVVAWLLGLLGWLAYWLVCCCRRCRCCLFFKCLFICCLLACLFVPVLFALFCFHLFVIYYLLMCLLVAGGGCSWCGICCCSCFPYWCCFLIVITLVALAVASLLVFVPYLLAWVKLTSMWKTIIFG